MTKNSEVALDVNATVVSLGAVALTSGEAIMRDLDWGGLGHCLGCSH